MRGMWKHLERLGGGTGRSAPASGRAAPASRSSRPTAASRRAGSRCSSERLRGPRARSARRGARQRQRSRDSDRRARRVHERGQVDAPERPHGRGGLGRRPPLRDARPDDARVRARRAPLPADGHGRVHPPAADAARRGVRIDARGDARRRPRRCTSPTRRCPTSGSRETIAAVESCAPRDRRRRRCPASSS